ncbi:MAG: class I SAM-dependent methyltransferase [Myxococcota bacterium]
MRSANADRFNHDDDADGYDADVRDESHPIRAGYDAVLSWVAAQVPDGSGVVVDLGSGTGNLAVRITAPQRLICVDISADMSAIATDKLAGRPFELIQADLLECFDTLPTADAIVSTYAIHHLTPDEKRVLFERCYERLAPDGVAAFGDLMFESRAAEAELLDAYARSGRAELVRDIRDEFFWHVDQCCEQLSVIGFEASAQRFSELSWGIVASKR